MRLCGAGPTFGAAVAVVCAAATWAATAQGGPGWLTGLYCGQTSPPSAIRMVCGTGKTDTILNADVAVVIKGPTIDHLNSYLPVKCHGGAAPHVMPGMQMIFFQLAIGSGGRFSSRTAKTQIPGFHGSVSGVAKGAVVRGTLTMAGSIGASSCSTGALPFTATWRNAETGGGG